MKTYRNIVHDLSQAYSDGEARALARVVCEEVLGLSQTDILLDKDNNLSADEHKKTEEIIIRLLKHEPIQHILGYTTFCGHRFIVAPSALIPRPETEQLVSAILSQSIPDSSTILDIGTGTGCIAISLSLSLPSACVTAWDISSEALSVARHNCNFHPEANVILEQVDILNPPATDRRWNIIVSNPPYIRQSEISQMDSNVLEHEPHLALFVPDNDPLIFYRAIAGFAQSHLEPNGQLWFEINEALDAETTRLFEDFDFYDITVFDDSFGKPRMLKGVKQV